MKLKRAQKTFKNSRKKERTRQTTSKTAVSYGHPLQSVSQKNEEKAHVVKYSELNRKRKLEDPSPSKPKKRVSFAPNLELHFDSKKKIVITPSDASPGKSIIINKAKEKSFVFKRTSGPEQEMSSREASVAQKVRDMRSSNRTKRKRIKMKTSDVNPNKSIMRKEEDFEFEQANALEEEASSREAKKMKASNANPGKNSMIEKGKEEDYAFEEASISEKVSSREVPVAQKEQDRRSMNRTKIKKIQITRKMKNRIMNMSRKERKAFIRDLQRKRKPNFDIVLRCKVLWETLRSGKTSDDERRRCVDEIYAMANGKAKEFIYAHDSCRVLECLLSSCSNEVRAALFNELTPEIVRMAKSKYSKHLVKKMLKLGTPTQRQVIFDAFRGHCVRMMQISASAEVLDTAYNDYANAEQRYDILIEFYGSDFHSFKIPDSTPRTLKKIIDDDPSRMLPVIRYLEMNLKNIVEKSQLKLSLTHRLLNDFFQFCSSTQMAEMIDSLKLRIPEMVHTIDGVRVASKCIWNGTTKERKAIVKSLKGLILKICQEEFGYRVLIAIFDVVDDTVLVNKYILQELLKTIGEILRSPHGVKVLHYLIHPRDSRFFSASQIAVFKGGDSNPHSKKPSNQRYSELFDFIKKPLLEYFAANMETLLCEKRASLCVLDALEPPTDLDLFERNIDAEDRLACYTSIATACSREFVPCDDEQLHPIEHPQAHFVVSKLLKADSKFEVQLGDEIVKHCGDQISSWIACNKGCFILLHLLENSSSRTQSFVKDAISLKAVAKYQTKGALLLAQKLAA